MEHEGGSDPWCSIAKALGVETHNLLFWEKLAKVVHGPRLPGYQSQDKPQPLLVGTLAPTLPVKSTFCMIPWLYAWLVLRHQAEVWLLKMSCAPYNMHDLGACALCMADTQ